MKNIPKSLPGILGKMEAKIAPGTPQDDEKWSKNFSGGPPARTSEFFFAPGGLQERSGVDFYSVLAAPWGPGGPQASGSSFFVILGAMLAPFWHRILSFGEPFWAPSWASGGRQNSSSRSISSSESNRSSRNNAAKTAAATEGTAAKAAARWPVLGRMPL